MTKLEDVAREMRSEVVDARTEVRHANDRLAAALDRVSRAEADRDAALARLAQAEGVRDDVLADRVARDAAAAQLAALADGARQLADDLAALAAGSEDAVDEHARNRRRRPLSLPGGVAGDSDLATGHLLRSGASILVDGYNVAKLGWPDLELAQQRRVLLDAVENFARRTGADLTVVFDGADVVGANTDQRRLARVVFSPPGVSADDVIRGEVGRLPAQRAVVVVTNDAAILADVRAAGANTVSSNRFLVAVRR